ncbi:non-secretory ribonuclease-like [Castor canadensis]|jgi:hypothetical protein|uniref:Non-secretory ribonuclease-like n=2 Tax=Castor canadensis TaxID=51338 RepID=A0AC58M0Z3_CASCN|nr:non-secretory ribonuclease-like [Castor canadensis]
MVAKLLYSRLCLLLLLGLLGIVPLLQAVPPGLTTYQWFAIQHINTGNIQCNIAMLRVNNYTGNCKRFNTFLNTTFTDALNVCNNRVTNCSNRIYQNCHNSSVRVPITECSLTTPSHIIRNCGYSQRPNTKFYRIACDPIAPPRNQTLVPVHLDGTF